MRLAASFADHCCILSSHGECNEVDIISLTKRGGEVSASRSAYTDCILEEGYAPSPQLCHWQGFCTTHNLQISNSRSKMSGIGVVFARCMKILSSPIPSLTMCKLKSARLCSLCTCTRGPGSFETMVCTYKSFEPELFKAYFQAWRRSQLTSPCFYPPQISTSALARAYAKFRD